ncbi:hypothetical protein CMI49_00695 [Candidatus Pacearchaeota archaeon]|mgnify:CR=1 FL=1|nr:hypothetical protein [Candidatus Pacearchaeota archaeon]|tara:strand:- start:3924 stop:4403 length:480 start_codon:yes stop_codon:yes gene_type:complete
MISLKNIGKKAIITLAMLVAFMGNVFAEQSTFSKIKDLEGKIASNCIKSKKICLDIPIGNKLYASIITEDYLSTKAKPDVFQLSISNKKGQLEYFVDSYPAGIQRPNTIKEDFFRKLDLKTSRISRSNLLYSMNNKDIKKLNELYLKRLEQVYDSLPKK